MAVTAIANGSGPNALIPEARIRAPSLEPRPRLQSEAPVRAISPTGAPEKQEAASPPVTGGARKPAVDLPGQLQAQEGGDKPKQKGELTEEEKEAVSKLRARDAEVHRHEQAHVAAGGQYAGAPSYTYQQGPDGKRYAVGGTTPIDTSPIPGDPQATARKLDQVRRAALAPGSPSGADLAIAAAAAAGAAQARAEASRVRREEQQGEGEEAPAPELPEANPVAQTDRPVAGQVAGQSEGGESSFAPTTQAPTAAQIGAYRKTANLLPTG